MKIKKPNAKVVHARIVESTTRPNQLSMRALDGHASTLSTNLTSSFKAGERVVLIQFSEYNKLKRRKQL